MATDFTQWTYVKNPPCCGDDVFTGGTQINTPILQKITSANFDDTLNTIDGAVYPVDTYFQSINLVTAGTDTALIIIEEVIDNAFVSRTVTMRVGNFLSVKGNRILTGTDATVVLNVGVKDEP